MILWKSKQFIGRAWPVITHRLQQKHVRALLVVLISMELPLLAYQMSLLPSVEGEPSTLKLAAQVPEKAGWEKIGL